MRNRMFGPIWGAKERGRRWWLWFFVFLTLELLLIRWLQQLQREGSKPLTRRNTEIQVATEPLAKPEEKAAVEKAEAARPKAMDFRRIEGIGPKVNQLLHEAGIRTYQQLADSSEEDLRAILREANLYMINPKTWPEQAKRAAKADWEGLKALQEELKGGGLKG